MEREKDLTWEKHPDETRLLVVEMSHDEVYFNVFYHFWQTIVLC